jgi:hypothetical protein
VELCAEGKTTKRVSKKLDQEWTGWVK